MKKLLVLLLLFLGMSCQKSELVENDRTDNSRGNEEVPDTVDVNVDVVPEGWGGITNVGFGFG